MDTNLVNVYVTKGGDKSKSSRDVGFIVYPPAFAFDPVNIHHDDRSLNITIKKFVVRFGLFYCLRNIETCYK